MKTLILQRNEIESLISMLDFINNVEYAFMAYNMDEVIQPDIISINVEKYNGEIDLKSGYLKTQDVIGIKAAGGFWDNPQKYNLPSVVSLICLFNAKNGMPVCILDGSIITAYRTAAAGAVAAKLLARKNSNNIAVIGSGVQAKLQVQALAVLFNIENVFVWNRSGANYYIKEMRNRLSEINFVECNTVKQAVESSDIIITTTASKKPLLYKEWVKKGTHINAIGCDMEGKQELDANIFKEAKIVNDCINECIKRGDTQHPIKQGIINRQDIYSEIGEILLSKKSGRISDDEITIFDSTGMSIQDIVCSIYIYNAAIRKQIGKNIEII